MNVFFLIDICLGCAFIKTCDFKGYKKCEKAFRRENKKYKKETRKECKNLRIKRNNP